MGQQPHEKRRPRLRELACAEDPRLDKTTHGKRRMRIVINMKCQANLLEVVLTTESIGRFPRFLHCGQHQRQQ